MVNTAAPAVFKHVETILGGGSAFENKRYKLLFSVIIIILFFKFQNEPKHLARETTVLCGQVAGGGFIQACVSYFTFLYLHIKGSPGAWELYRQ